MHRHYSQHWFWGTILLLLGLLLLLDSLEVMDFGYAISRFWPLLLILIGLRIILISRNSHRFAAGDINIVDESPFLNLSHNFGNIKMKLTSQEFTGGSVSNVFGNIEIDLGEVKLKDGIQNLFINGVFGETRIMLPKTASVSVQAAVNFGSVQIKERSASGISSALSYSTDGFENASAKLYLKAHQSMGNLRLS